MSKVRQKMKASKKANELISSALWVAICGLGNGAKYNTARQNLEDYIAELEGEVTKGHELQDAYCDRIAELEESDKHWAGNVKVCMQLIERYESDIAELEEAQRWIPVGERPLDNWESVLTIDISKSTRDMVTAFYNPETSLWSTHFSCDLWVTHWMPLPEPPIVYGKECEE